MARYDAASLSTTAGARLSSTAMSSYDVGPYDAESSYRRMHRTTVVSTMVSILPVGILLVAVQARSWWEAAVLGGAFLAVAGVMSQWGRTGYPRFGTAGLALCLLVWVIGVFVFETSIAFFPLVMVGAMVVPRLPRWRVAGTVGFGLLVGGVGAAAVWRDPDLDIMEFAVIPGGIALFVTAMMFYSDRYWVIFHELEQARKAEAELGIMQERVRFASELHDIQGHTLHVVKLKVALAEKLVEHDAGRAAEELREVHELVGDTITQTKELAYAQRRLNLAGELENAKNLFEAAGIRVSLTQQNDEALLGDSPHDELLGQVLRETTTNILRHAQASEVEIVLSVRGITITNDGAHAGEAGAAAQPRLRGLENLKQRLTDTGGELRVEQQGPRFVTEAHFTGVASGQEAAR